MLCVEEPGQSLVLGWVELPQVESPLLTREDPAKEHDLDNSDKFNLPADQVFDTGLMSSHLCRITPQQARLFPRCEPCGDTRSEFEGRCPFRVTRLGDIEPPRLPPFDGLYEGALEPCNVGYLAHHGTSALRLAATHNLRLDAEDLQP